MKKQESLIQKFNQLFSHINEVQAVIIIGSFGRGNPQANSDIDYQILVNEEFDNKTFIEVIKSSFLGQLKHCLFLKHKNKWCFYLTDDYIAVELFIHYNKKELNKYFLGSEIVKPENSVVFDKTNSITKYFNLIIERKEKDLDEILKKQAEHLVVEFQNRFEACSCSHAKSDGYKFYVLFSHALNAVIQLMYLCKGGVKHNYMPPNFLTTYGGELKEEIEGLTGVSLPKANTKKRKLLDIFVEYLPIAIQHFNLKIDQYSIIDFLENIIKRDCFWNFRDISKFNSRIKQGIVYRSSASLCLHKEEECLNVVLKNNNVKTIIDLRVEKELNSCDYSREQRVVYEIINIPFNTWGVSKEFENTYKNETPMGISYYFYLIECKENIKRVIEVIIKSIGAINIHCFAGKDRTGVVVALLHLLSGAKKEDIILDYLASESDTKASNFQIVFKVIKESGGIINYLESCALSKIQITKLKQKICN